MYVDFSSKGPKCPDCKHLNTCQAEDAGKKLYICLECDHIWPR